VRALNKRFALAGGVLLALGAAGGGVAAAQSAEPAGGCPPLLAKPIAGANLGVAVPDTAAHQKFEQTLASKLGVSVDRLKQVTAEARKEAGLPEALTAVAFGPGKVFTLEGGDPLTPAATALNLTIEQLREELKSKSLSDLARSKGVDPATVATALKNDERARIDAAVAKGGLPADVAEKMRAGVDARVEQLLTARFSAGGDFTVACGGAAGVAFATPVR
jgi:hypothetical protein